MPRPLRLLSVEDVEDDYILQIETLKVHGFDPFSRRVESQEELLSALVSEWDIVLCDYTLPRFDGKRALQLVREHRPNLPFIVVSGTVGEEIAAELMRSGANDYILKSRPWRLGPVIDRELLEADVRRQKIAAEAALTASTDKYRSVVEQASDGIVLIDRDGAFLEANRAALAMAGYAENDLLPARVMDFVDAGDATQTPLAFRTLLPGQAARRRRPLRRKDGSIFHADISTTALEDGRALLVLRDVTDQVKAETTLLCRERQHRALGKLGGVIASGATRDEIFTFAADILAETLGMPFCRIAECGADGPSIRARAGCPRDAEDRPCTVNADYIARVVGADAPVKFNPAEHGPVHACFNDYGIVAGVSLGIGTPERPIAVIDLHSRAPREFDADENLFLQSVASILGSAIEQKRSEEAMRRSEERFRRYFELGLVGMATISAQREWLEVNDRLCESSDTHANSFSECR